MTSFTGKGEMEIQVLKSHHTIKKQAKQQQQQNTHTHTSGTELPASVLKKDQKHTKG